MFSIYVTEQLAGERHARALAAAEARRLARAARGPSTWRVTLAGLVRRRPARRVQLELPG